jgi:hypothetical protein
MNSILDGAHNLISLAWQAIPTFEHPELACLSTHTINDSPFKAVLILPSIDLQGFIKVIWRKVW